MEATLLLVDDDRAFRDALAEVLTASALGKVLVADDGEEAYERICENEIDLLITDINMPRLSGIGLVQRLRDDEREMPIIVVTGVPHGLDRVHELGVEAVFLKPFKLLELVAQIRQLLVDGSEAGEESS
jgi:two-component system chemotaxis response regulator CheY